MIFEKLHIPTSFDLYPEGFNAAKMAPRLRDITNNIIAMMNTE